MRDGSTRQDSVGRVAGEIDSLRGELGGLVAELDRRRREAVDLRLQIRRHPILVAAIATGAALILGGAIAALVNRQRNRRRPSVRARETRAALSRLFEHPNRVAAERSVTSKIVTAVSVAVATTLAKRFVERSVPPEPKARTH